MSLHFYVLLYRWRENGKWKCNANASNAYFIVLVGMTLNDAVTAKRQQTRERKRIMSLIPRYLRALRNFDTSITTLNLNRLGVDTHDLRLFSIPLISGHTRVTELYLEGNQIGVEGATAIAKIICSARYLKDVSLANNPGKFYTEMWWWCLLLVLWLMGRVVLYLQPRTICAYH